MKYLSIFRQPCSAMFIGVIIAATLFSTPVIAQNQPEGSNPAKQPMASAPDDAMAVERDKWRKGMLLRPRPEKGCFTATYPDTEWREIPCLSPRPTKPYPPRSTGTTSLETVGGSGPDFSGTVTGHISQAEGSFDSATGITTTGAYSLQLNTAPFDTSACSGSPNNTHSLATGCRGWEQFVYDSSGSANIQYWLLDYGPVGTSCPAPKHTSCAANSVYSDGWCPFNISLSPGDANPIQCAVNSSLVSPPAQAMTGVGNVKVSGSAGGVTDSMVVSVSGTPTGVGGGNYFPDLGSQWNEAEFNVFGNGSSATATFNSGSNLVVRTEVLSGTTSGPGCHMRSWTGESTNLSLGTSPPVSPAPLPAPALVFSESNPAQSGTPSCADADSLGDTHLRTFGGLLYDFQATGDFVLAETGRDFQVQTRQVSGAPSWPNAAVNKAVAVRAGKDQVAMCLPERVVVNGKPATVPDGGYLVLASGGTVFRKANVYTVLAVSGDSARAEMNGTYINVSVGLGNWPSKVRGLIVNASGTVNEVVARDGAVLISPFAFEKLYGHYADSWRVSQSESMLGACGENILRGVPKKPFFATDLPPKLAKRNRLICSRAGVKEGPLLDACMIDVAMLGAKAATTFARKPAPVAVGDERRR
ncbi:VWD domain-containing protein [Caballeronia mineralivorans]|uniref:VWD domain-containing protein n=1 Tax=Caballeronia mineralivorans TaxID=2010198 RepID=UPI0023F31DB0|nr:VWD domain-containing protein [Caballeronia mineralivorans]